MESYEKRQKILGSLRPTSLSASKVRSFRICDVKHLIRGTRDSQRYPKKEQKNEKEKYFGNLQNNNNKRQKCAHITSLK